MPATPQKLLLIASQDDDLQEAMDSLLYGAAIPATYIADIFGTCPAHVREWAAAAPKEPHKQAYVPAWVYCCLLLWNIANPAAGWRCYTNYPGMADACAAFPPLHPT